MPATRPLAILTPSAWSSSAWRRSSPGTRRPSTVTTRHQGKPGDGAEDVADRPRRSRVPGFGGHLAVGHHRSLRDGDDDLDHRLGEVDVGLDRASGPRYRPAPAVRGGEAEPVSSLVSVSGSSADLVVDVAVETVTMAVSTSWAPSSAQAHPGERHRPEVDRGVGDGGGAVADVAAGVDVIGAVVVDGEGGGHRRRRSPNRCRRISSSVQAVPVSEGRGSPSRRSAKVITVAPPVKVTVSPSTATSTPSASSAAIQASWSIRACSQAIIVDAMSVAARVPSSRV